MLDEVHQCCVDLFILLFPEEDTRGIETVIW